MFPIWCLLRICGSFLWHSPLATIHLFTGCTSSESTVRHLVEIPPQAAHTPLFWTIETTAELREQTILLCNNCKCIYLYPKGGIGAELMNFPHRLDRIEMRLVHPSDSLNLPIKILWFILSVLSKFPKTSTQKQFMHKTRNGWMTRQLR